MGQETWSMLYGEIYKCMRDELSMLLWPKQDHLEELLAIRHAFLWTFGARARRDALLEYRILKLKCPYQCI